MRERLTRRASDRKADQREPISNIDLGHGDDRFHEMDEYHTWKPVVNHPLPDYGKITDKRGEAGLGVVNPEYNNGMASLGRVASVYVSAKKAARLAMMLLGENASDQLIERQARDFMRMGEKAINASVQRLAECVGENCDDGGCKDGECKNGGCKDGECKNGGCKDGECACDQTACDDKGACVADDETVAQDLEAGRKKKAPEAAPAPAPAPAVEAAPAPAAAPAEAAPAPAAPAADAIPVADGEGNIPVDAAPADGLTVDFADGESSDIPGDIWGDAAPEAAPAPAPATASKKAGIKHLAGQPRLTRVASDMSADNLSALWDSWNHPAAK